MSERGQHKPDPVWCVVANVREETPVGEGDREKQRGSKHFEPGAKVYCFRPLWGDGYENVKVVGRHRGSHRYVTMVIDSKYLINWRAELVYSPHVIGEMKGYWDGTRKSRKRAESLVAFKIGRPTMPWPLHWLRRMRELFRFD